MIDNRKDHLMMFLLLYDKTGSPSRHIKARQILPITQPPKKESKARNAAFVVASKNFLQSAYLRIKKDIKAKRRNRIGQERNRQ